MAFSRTMSFVVLLAVVATSLSHVAESQGGTTTAAPGNLAQIMAQCTPTIRMRCGLGNIIGFNTTDVSLRLMAAVRTRTRTRARHNWPSSLDDAVSDPLGVASRLRITACEVEDAFTGGLNGTVCATTTTCSTPYNASCPQRVRLCACPIDVITPSSRGLEVQQSTAAPVRVQLEATFRYVASDLAAFSDSCQFMKEAAWAAVSALKNDSEFVAYSIDDSTITVYVNDAVLSSASRSALGHLALLLMLALVSAFGLGN